MSEAQSDMVERHGRNLARLGEMGMALAEKLYESAMAAETPEETERLAQVFHTISRSTRQSFALEARLAREAQRAAAEAARAAGAARTASAERRRVQARVALDRLVWTESERPDRDALLIAARERLVEEAADEDRFLDGALEDLVARILRNLGLAGTAARYLARAAEAAPVPACRSPAPAAGERDDGFASSA